MKKILILISIGVILTGTAATIQANNAANCRLGPGLNYDILTQVSGGNDVTILGQDISRDWYKVEISSGEVCWIGSTLITLSGSEGEIPILKAPPAPPAPPEFPAIAIAYGETKYGEMTAENQVEFYVFWGDAGDVVTIFLAETKDELDTWVELHSPKIGAVLARQDDMGGICPACFWSRIPNYTLPYTGWYYIEVTTFLHMIGYDMGHAWQMGEYKLMLEKH